MSTEQDEALAYLTGPEGRRELAGAFDRLAAEVAAEAPGIMKRSFDNLSRLGFTGPAAPILRALSEAPTWIDHAPDCAWLLLADRPGLEWSPRKAGGAIARCPECRRWVEVGPGGERIAAPKPTGRRSSTRERHRQEYLAAVAELEREGKRPTDAAVARRMGIINGEPARTIRQWRHDGIIPRRPQG